MSPWEPDWPLEPGEDELALPVWPCWDAGLLFEEPWLLLEVEALLEDELLDDGLLEEELLEEELLEDEEELLLDEELDGLLGVAGGCGVVGLLALGQPANNRHRPATEAGGMKRVSALLWLLDFIGPCYHFRVLWLSHGQSRPETGLAQRAQHPVCRPLFEVAFVHTGEICDLALFVNIELHP